LAVRAIHEVAYLLGISDGCFSAHDPAMSGPACGAS